MEYNFVNQPDLAQTFVVTCAMLNIPFHFTGLESLKIKETDRITALIQELRKMGFVIKDANDSELFWDGEKDTPQPNIVIDTYDDHRMAMAFAPCAFVFPEICINHPEVVSKSYPQYWEHLKNIGFKITE
jgi:3-phosphoshikimate 1-carboxyvinyltransferase